MVKPRRFLTILLILSLMVMISACNSKKDKTSVEDVRVGKEGVIINFLSNSPPDTIRVDSGSDTPFEVVLEVKNRGAFPQPDDNIPAPRGRIYLSGFDRNILAFDKTAEILDNKPLYGKSTISPNGGIDLFTFKGQVNIGNLNVEKYEPTIQATACYEYRTITAQNVCIDPIPYATVDQKKVCTASDVSMSDQGGPVAITAIDEEAFATKTQFRITFKNAGNGNIVYLNSMGKCSPEGELKSEDINKIYLASARVGTKELSCGPFMTSGGGLIKGASGDVRLVNGEGFIICEMPSSDYGDTKSAYMSPMRIEILYGYKTSVEKKISIRKESAGFVGESTSSSSSIPQYNNPDLLPVDSDW